MKTSAATFSALLNDSRVQSLKAIFAGRAELFLVGGCVRDCVLQGQVKDLDITCALSAQQMLAILTEAGVRCIETGARHGTITAVIEGDNVEITSFRGDPVRVDPVRVDPVHGTEIQSALFSDLEKRDFSINALAVSINSGELFDPLNGMNDLKSKILRAPPSATERFREDPLRILRMIRFGPARGFSIEQATLEAAQLMKDSLSLVSIERIQHEFSLILVAAFPRSALLAMLDLGLIEMFIPEALPSVGFEQNDFHTESVFDHTLSVIENAPADLKLRLAAFFHDFGKPHTLSVDEQGNRHFYEHEIKSAEICESVMERLKYSHDLTKSVSTIVRYHMRPVDCGPSGIRRLLRDLGTEFGPWRTFKEADHPPIFSLEDTLVELKIFDEKVQAELDRAALEKQKKLVLSGYDLMELGFSAGPALGKAIKQLEEEVIDDPTRNSKEYLLRRAQELLSSQQT